MTGTNETKLSCCAIDASTLRPLLLLVVAGIIVICVSIPGFAVPSSADLELNSEPAGASAFLNGRLIGATPLLINRLKLGRYSLRVEKEGYTPLQRNIALLKDGLSLRETLQALPTTELTVSIKPDGSEVLLDGELMGYTPLHIAEIPLGPHDLVVRKTNFNNYAKHLEAAAGQPLLFKDFSLDDKIMAMLKGNIAKESWRVMNYMDLGHYFFVNNRMKESADLYGKALGVSADPLDLPKETTEVERQLQARLRSEDRGRLMSQIAVKEHWPGKDCKTFTDEIEHNRNAVNDQHIREAGWILEQVGNYYNNGQYEEAESTLLKHMAVLCDVTLLEQQHLSLLNIRIRKKKLPLVQATVQTIQTNYAAKPELLRQTGDAIYNAYATFEVNDRPEMLALSERMFRAGLEAARTQKNTELQALCTYQLALTLDTGGHGDQAVPLLRESIDGTKDVPSKEARTQRLADCYKTMKNFEEARKLLDELSKSPREPVASKAKQELNEIASLIGKKQ